MSTVYVILMPMKQAAIAVIFNDARTEVVLVKRRDVPVWVLPGGGVDAGEKSEAAAVREAFEETGLQVEIKKKVGEYSPINSLAEYTEVFECASVGGHLTLGDETAAVQYWRVDALPKTLFVVHKDWLQDAFRNEPVVLQKKINQVTYWNVFLHFCLHPTWVLRFLWTKVTS